VTNDHGAHPGLLIVPRHVSSHSAAALVRAVTKASMLRILQSLSRIAHLYQKFAERLHCRAGCWDSSVDEEDFRCRLVGEGFPDIGFGNQPGIEGENPLLQFAWQLEVAKNLSGRWWLINGCPIGLR